MARSGTTADISFFASAKSLTTSAQKPHAARIRCSIVAMGSSSTIRTMVHINNNQVGQNHGDSVVLLLHENHRAGLRFSDTLNVVSGVSIIIVRAEQQFSLPMSDHRVSE